MSSMTAAKRIAIRFDNIDEMTNQELIKLGNKFSNFIENELKKSKKEYTILIEELEVKTLFVQKGSSLVINSAWNHK